MLCEICGKEVPFTKMVSVEGSIMTVCGGCMRFGTEISTRKPESPLIPSDKMYLPVKKPQVRDIYSEMGDLELVDDFGWRIRNARTTRGLKQEDLGRLINEKKSVIEQLEKGRIRPDDKLSAKLEKALGIKLKEKIREGQIVKKSGGAAITLGDLLDNQQK